MKYQYLVLLKFLLMNTNPSKQKRESNQMVFGIRAVIEAIRSGKDIEAIYVQRGLNNNLFLELRALLKEHELSYQQVPVEKLNRITTKNHQGVIGVISPVT